MRVDLAYYKNRIETDLMHLNEALVLATTSAGTVALDQSSIGRVSRIDALQQQALAQGLMERLVIRKRKIEAALARIDCGTYGRCCACQRDLEPERLNADPAAVFCQECAAGRQ